jgi:hypothetical protein
MKPAARSARTTLLSITTLLLILTLNACEFPTMLDSNLATQEQSLSGDEEGLAAGSDQDSGSAEDESGDMEDFECPFSPEAFEMWFNHDISYNTGMIGEINIKTSGGILLTIAEGILDDAVKMTIPVGQVTVPGVATATFERDGRVCQLEQELTVIVNVDGTCDDGVIKLNITENYGIIDKQLECCKEGDCRTGPFVMPLKVVQFGEIVFSSENQFQHDKEFGGGRGWFHWEITPPMPPVPLTD